MTDDKKPAREDIVRDPRKELLSAILTYLSNGSPHASLCNPKAARAS